jgi:hypothetical protein
MRLAANSSSAYLTLQKHKKGGAHARTRYCEHLKGLPLLPTVQFGKQSGMYDFNATGVFEYGLLVDWNFSVMKMSGDQDLWWGRFLVIQISGDKDLW